MSRSSRGVKDPGRALAWGLAATTVCAFAAAAPPTFPGATQSYKSWIAAKLPGAPEGLTQDAEGRIYAAVSTTGEIVRLVEGAQYVHVATVPSAGLAAEGRTWGIAFGPDGALYAAFVWHYSEAEEMDPLHLGCRDSRDQFTGVYRVDIETGSVTPWLTKREGWSLCFPDDVAYPFLREAAWLSEIFQNVYYDAGVILNFAGPSNHRIMREDLEMGPFTKQLVSTDAFGLAELHFLGVVQFKRAMRETLDDWIGRGDCTAADAEEIFALIARDNAKRIYPLT